MKKLREKKGDMLNSSRRPLKLVQGHNEKLISLSLEVIKKREQRRRIERNRWANKGLARQGLVLSQLLTRGKADKLKLRSENRYEFSPHRIRGGECFEKARERKKGWLRGEEPLKVINRHTRQRVLGRENLQTSTYESQCSINLLRMEQGENLCQSRTTPQG